MARRLIWRALLVMTLVAGLAWIALHIQYLSEALWLPSIPGFRHTTISQLNHYCQTAPKQNDFGIIHLHGTIKVLNQNGVIDTPCQIFLKDGAHLIINHSNFRTSKFVIRDESANGHPSSLKITGSNFAGAGLLMHLQANGSQIYIDRSHFIYPLSITVNVGSGDNNERVKSTITNSYFKSNDPRSQGITIVSTGQGTFYHNQFVLTDVVDFPLLLATHCYTVDNRGAGPHCQLD